MIGDVLTCCFNPGHTIIEVTKQSGTYIDTFTAKIIKTKYNHVSRGQIIDTFIYERWEKYTPN